MQFGESQFCDFVIGKCNDFTCFLIHYVMSQYTSQEKILRHSEFIYACLLHFPNVFNSYTFIFLHDDLAALGGNVEARHIAAQTFRYQIKQNAFFGQMKNIKGEKIRKNLLLCITYRFQQYGDRHLTAAINAKVEIILGVELEIEPRTAIWNNARRKKQLAGRMRFPAIMLKKYPW